MVQARASGTPAGAATTSCPSVHGTAETQAASGGRRTASGERTTRYIVEEDSPGWQIWLAFRDHLRESVADRNEYTRIKCEPAAVDDEDRLAYRPRRSSPEC